MSIIPASKMKRRMLIVAVIICIVMPAILVGRLFQLQIIDGEKYQKLALQQQVTSAVITANRGAIYDRNMKALAKSANVWTVILNPANIEDDEQKQLLADNLSVILEIEPQKILDHAARTKSKYEVLKSKVEQETADKVTAFVNENKLTCVDLVEDSKRYYPYGNLASTVLGFTNSENNGAYGLESYYNKVLSGTPGRVTSAKTGWQTDMDFRYQKMYEAVDGNSLVLTIDEVIQHSLEKNLETAVIEHGIKKRAVGIVMDVNTGQILGMSTKNDFDPNKPNEIYDPKTKLALEEQKAAADAESDEKAKEKLEEEYLKAVQKAQFDQWSNKCVTDPMEPGSVFKIVTASSALESGTSTPSSTFTCGGSLLVGGWNISCWKPGGHGTQDFKHALMHSCNPAFMMIGQAMGVHTFCTFFDAFGMNEVTGIDLPGEAPGVAHKEKDMGIVELSSSSFGQTFKVTPIQMITAVSAAVNGGKLMQPYVVQQILDKDNNVIETIEPVVKRQVISEETSALMRDMMEGVVAEPDGSGKSAHIPGYRIGGKTGTSEKLDLYDENGVRMTEFGLSFVGVAPIDKPQIAVYVMLDEPTTVGYGSVIAAPIVQGVLKDVLPYMGIQPQYTDEELAKTDISVPNVMGKITHGAQSEITIAGLTPRVIGTGSSVLKQIPQGGEKMPRGGTVILYTELSEDTMVEVPNVVGLSGQTANKTIINSGLNIRLAGEIIDQTTDLVISQTPEAGKQVEAGSVVTIRFSDNEAAEPSIPTLIAPGEKPPAMAQEDQTVNAEQGKQESEVMISGIRPKDKDKDKDKKQEEKEKPAETKPKGTFNSSVGDRD